MRARTKRGMSGGNFAEDLLAAAHRLCGHHSSLAGDAAQARDLSQIPRLRVPDGGGGGQSC